MKKNTSNSSVTELYLKKASKRELRESWRQKECRDECFETERGEGNSQANKKPYRLKKELASPPFPCVNIWPTQYLPFPNSDTQGR